MTKRINAVIARKNLGELLEGVFYRGDEIIVERAGKPMGVLIPLSQYEKIERSRAQALKSLEKAWNGASNPAASLEDAEEDLLSEVLAVRYALKQ